MNNTYWRVFYIAWTPVRWIASFLWLNEWIPLGPFGPYILGASICRWPNRVKRGNRDAHGYEGLQHAVVAAREYAARASVAAPPPDSIAPCGNCNHALVHNAPAGAIADGCPHKGCNCGYYQPSPVAAPVDVETETVCWFCVKPMEIYWLPDSEPRVCHVACKCGASGPWEESEDTAIETWRNVNARFSRA